MKNTTGIKEAILGSRKKADAAMKAIHDADPLTHEFFTEKIREYVLAKYMLSPDGDLPENFHELAELSLSRSMKISPELVKEFDMARSCDGVSSVMAKKVLLFMNIQKQLQIELPAKGTATVKNLNELADLAWNEMVGSPVWQNISEG